MFSSKCRCETDRIRRSLIRACGYVYNSALSLRSLLGGGLGVHSVPSGHEVCNHDQEK